jgi:hypothetical protein
MNRWKKYVLVIVALLISSISSAAVVMAQDSPVLLTGTDLSRVVPPGFYFQGLSATTQARNSAAVRFGMTRFVIAGLVDTSGYAADVREKYEGFLITDSAITINGSELPTGAYGFGFSNDGKLNILDLGGKEILSISTKKDGQLARPRPLTMIKSGNEIRLYSRRDYVVIGTK